MAKGLQSAACGRKTLRGFSGGVILSAHIDVYAYNRRQAAWTSNFSTPSAAVISVIISSTDEKLYRTLGINVCCEPKYEQHRYYHK